jgi:hypothetical protein
MNRPISWLGPIPRLLMLMFAGTLVSPGLSAQTTGDANANPHALESSAGRKFSSTKSVRSRAKALSVVWPPKDVDAAVPVVAPEVSCPLAEVMLEARQRAEDLVANLEKFTATEVIDTSEVRGDGRPKQPVKESFSYSVAVSRNRGGFPEIDESRSKIGRNTAGPAITTAGLAAGMLIFHPYYVGDFNIVCEGLGEWNKMPAWQLRFEQRSDALPRFQSIHVGDRWFRPRFKGRAWLTRDHFQIARMSFDLADTIPKIKLVTEHSDIDYGPVDFANRKMQLWVPENVDFYIDIGGHRFFHHHRLSDFLLFSVETNQEFSLPH